jgi:hypothetical protein
MAFREDKNEKCWYVLRDLKRPNAKLPAYRELSAARFEVFTPLEDRVVTRGGRRIREEIPFIRDLLFVHDTRDALDPVVEQCPTLQYRFQKGGGYKKPMTVAGAAMERFIHAVSVSKKTRYYLPEEITPDMFGRDIRIVGGPLDGHEGRLLTARGSKRRWLLVELPNFLTAAVEVSPEFIRVAE